jgi:predicted nucleic acid-binding protein
VRILIDTSVVVALLLPMDSLHAKAVALWDAIKRGKHAPVHTDCVAAEAVSAATRRLFEKGRSVEVGEFLDRVEEHIRIEDVNWVLRHTQRLYPDILALIRSSRGALNFNDALIALVCRESGIPAIASFDADFDQLPWLRRLAQPSDL